MGRFDDKVVFVTGGAKSQGRSHALAFAKEGADIVVCDIARQLGSIPHTMGTQADLDETARMVEKLDQRCVAITADSGTPTRSTAPSAGRVRARPVDILLANPGCSRCPRRRDDRRAVARRRGLDLTGCSRPPRRHPAHGGAELGRIIATSSMAGRIGLPTLAHYCAAKWGVIGGEVGGPGGGGERRHGQLRVPDQHGHRHDPQAAFYGSSPRASSIPPRTRPSPGSVAQRHPGAVDRGDRHLQRDDVPGLRRGPLHHRRGAARVSAGWNAFNAA